MKREDVGFYSDDCFGVCQNLPGSAMDRTRKKLIKIFKYCDLSTIVITITKITIITIIIIMISIIIIIIIINIYSG